MTNAGKCKSVATALIKASRNEVPGAAKGMAKHAREAFQNPAQPTPKPDKIDGRGGSESQNAPKRHPRPAKRYPRATKKGPRLDFGGFGARPFKMEAKSPKRGY